MESNNQPQNQSQPSQSSGDESPKVDNDSVKGCSSSDSGTQNQKGCGKLMFYSLDGWKRYCRKHDLCKSCQNQSPQDEIVEGIPSYAQSEPTADIHSSQTKSIRALSSNASLVRADGIGKNKTVDKASGENIGSIPDSSGADGHTNYDKDNVKYLGADDLCPNCNGLIRIRNPTGKCDHLYYPENVPKDADDNKFYKLGKRLIEIGKELRK